MEKHGFLKVLLAGVAGLAAGFALGILLAPDKGSVTREKLREKIQDLNRRVREEFTGETEKEQ
jgi:gas vesicle protein